MSSPPRVHRIATVLLVLLLVSLQGVLEDPGASTPDPSLAMPRPDPTVPEPCLAPYISCGDGTREDVPEQTRPMAGDYLLEQLRPHLDRETYQLLEALVGGKNTPPVPLPPQPQEVGVDVEARLHLKAHTGHGNQHVKVHVHAEENVSLVGHGGPEDHEQVPCGDPRGCPDLVVDPAMLAVGIVQTQTFVPEHCAVVENATEPGTRRLLRFTFTTPNLGDGDLVIGNPNVRPEWFEWGECHGHHHFRDYADYRLWMPEGYVRWLDARSDAPEKTPAQVLEEHPDLRDEMVAGHKQGFCAIDVRPYAVVDPPKYSSCADNQGISRGWADEYSFSLDGQWVDVTGLPPGPYVLEGEVNPERLYQEIDYANNAAAVLVEVPPQT